MNRLVATVFAVAVILSLTAATDDWKKIGSEELKRGSTSASIRVGAEDGFFRWLKLRVAGGKVDIRKVTVKLTVGEDKTFNSFATLGDGQETRVLMISTVTKALIDRVVIDYEIKSDGDGGKPLKIVVLGRREND